MPDFLQLVFRIFIIWFASVCLGIAAGETNPVCQTEDCKKLGDYYLENMDKNENPCNDFFNYVCHGWGTHHPKPATTQTWKVMDLMGQQKDNKLRDLLRDRSNTDQPYETQAKAIYDACLNLPYMNKSTPEVIKNYMQKIGNWPMFMSEDEETNLSWTEIHNQYLKDTGESALFDVGVFGDHHDNYNVVTKFAKIFSAHGMLKRITKWKRYSRQRSHYKLFLYKVVQSVGPVNAILLKESINKDLEDVLNFRDKLDDITRDLPTLAGINIRTIEEFQNWYDELENETETTKINWLEVVQALYKNSAHPKSSSITNSTNIEARELYFENLHALLADTPMIVIVNHIHLFFAERHVTLRSGMIRELEYSCGDETFPNATIRYEKPREIRCIQSINVRDGLEKMFVKIYFTNETKEKITQYMKDTNELLLQHINESDWMSEERIRNVSKKIEKVKYMIGYPDDLMTRTLYSYRRWFEPNALTVNAYYIETANFVGIPAAMMQPPVYTPDMPYVIDYGSTVFILGHETIHGLSHAINDTFQDMTTASLLDQDQHLNHIMLKMCLGQHHKSMRADDLKARDIDPYLDQIETIEEDMADVLGLNLAYELFKKKLNESNGICPVLPGFEDMSCEKLFFIAFANTQCAIPLPADGDLMLKDRHSRPPTRVNGAVKNMKEFSAAFNCNADDAMNAQERCEILQFQSLVKS